ncbi:hypothetical protein [Rhodococcus sp. ACT016]|uniref:hypothetical protein n=1 Tax=Rhodococcus sp. ACT016 TaxID=3134808 RepID=UPI003D279D1F
MVAKESAITVRAGGRADGRVAPTVLSGVAVEELSRSVSRASRNTLVSVRKCVRLLLEIQPVSFRDITVAPFSVTAHGCEFGLILNGPDSEDDHEWYWNVTVEPGDYMAFYAPWDDGDYDT